MQYVTVKFSLFFVRGLLTVEEGVTDTVIDGLKARGYTVEGPLKGFDRMRFGRGHVITKGAWWKKNNPSIIDDRRVLWAGSDSRADGTPLPL